MRTFERFLGLPVITGIVDFCTAGHSLLHASAKHRSLRTAGMLCDVLMPWFSHFLNAAARRMAKGKLGLVVLVYRKPWNSIQQNGVESPWARGQCLSRSPCLQIQAQHLVSNSVGIHDMPPEAQLSTCLDMATCEKRNLKKQARHHKSHCSRQQPDG